MTNYRDKYPFRWHCNACKSFYSTQLERCPNCSSTETIQEIQWETDEAQEREERKQAAQKAEEKKKSIKKAAIIGLAVYILLCILMDASKSVSQNKKENSQGISVRRAEGTVGSTYAENLSNTEPGERETVNRPTPLFSLEAFRKSDTWGLQYYGEMRDGRARKYSECYKNQGTKWGLAPGSAAAKYILDGLYKTLKGTLAREKGTVPAYLEIYLDDVLVYTSPALKEGDEAVDFEIDITSADLITINVISGGEDWWSCNELIMSGFTLCK